MVLELAFTSPVNATDENFEGFLELVIEGIENIGRDDIEVTASLTKRTASFTVFEGDTAPSADEFMSAVRTSLHAANCRTKGWEDASMRLLGEAQLANA